MTDAPRALRAGVVGLGMMGRNHVRVWDEMIADVELAAVADPDSAALRRATTGRAARGYPDPATMFAEEQLDLVSIVAPTSLHLPVALAALEAGVHVLVEKPIASDRGEAEAPATSSASTRPSASSSDAWRPTSWGASSRSRRRASVRSRPAFATSAW
jgi:predicted dehydrogenase